MKESRRAFLKELGGGTLALGVGLPLLDAVPWSSASRALSTEPAVPADPAASGPMQWGLVVDVEKCLQDEVRRAVMDACHREHNVPRIPDPEERIDWIWSEPLERVFPDEVHAHTPPGVRGAPVLVLCNHCTNPPCVRVCPTAATWKREQDGIVMMDMHRCIGCRYCMAACPYGARSFNWREPRDWVETDATGKPVSDYPTRSLGVVEKCTFCAERLRVGLPPACVEAANGVPGGEGALTFGDLTDRDSNVSRALRERITFVRKVSLGTGPNVYYLLPQSIPTGAAVGTV